jgi:ArsR family transcriptional regulator
MVATMTDDLSACKALGDPARLRIVDFLWRPEASCCSFEDRVCACDIEGVLGLSQPAVSHHMKLLVQAGLVASEKDGRWVYYRLNRERFRELAQFFGQFGKQGTAPATKKPARNAA